MAARIKPDYESLSDPELAACVGRGESGAVRLVTQRNNRRLFRTAWSILKDREDAEDTVQSAYLRGFAAIAGFEGKSSLSTWLTRIVINEALGRRRAKKRRRAWLEADNVLFLADYREKMARGSVPQMSAEASVARGQIREMLETAIAGLPGPFRTAFILRDVEGLSVAEVAEILDIPAATVKTRHLRARRRLQQELAPELKHALTGTFPFAGVDCARVTERIIRAFHAARPGGAGPRTGIPG